MLADTYIFYADVYLIQNLMMKVAVLILTIKLLKIQMRKPVMKVLGIALAATLLEIAGLFFIPSYTLYVGLSHIIEVPGMMLVLLHGEKVLLKKAVVLGYLCVMLENGVVEILWNMIGLGWLYPLLVLVGNVLGILLICFAVKRWRMSKGVYPVDIYFPDMIWTVKAFYDSGNHLRDPYTGKSVHIISKHLAKRLEFSQEKKVCIPYQAIGKEDGLLDVYYVDEIKIRKQESVVTQKSVPLAVAEDTVFAGKGYEMIMNEDVW